MTDDDPRATIDPIAEARMALAVWSDQDRYPLVGRQVAAVIRIAAVHLSNVLAALDAALAEVTALEAELKELKADSAPFAARMERRKTYQTVVMAHMERRKKKTD